MKRVIKKNNIKESGRIIDSFSAMKKDFTVSETNYTTVIKTNKSRIMFNPEGKPDTAGLYLINKTRADAREYIKRNEFERLETGSINWYLYNDINGRRNPKGECIKLDLNSAYWATAIKMGVVTEETVEQFEKMSKERTKKESKQLRLKALGSLATIKHITEYEKGEVTKETHEAYDLELRQLYIAICKEVDRALFGIMRKHNLLYYYWDMILINDKNTLEVVKKDILELGYEFTVKADLYEIFKGAYLSFIQTYGDNIQYPIRQRDVLNDN